MTLTPVKTPKLVKRMFPNYIWNIQTTNKIIYLTFDDGPTPEITNWTLNLLKQYKAKATFFCIGNNIEKHPEIFKDILNDAHAIGNHTHSHIKGWKTLTKNYLIDVEKGQRAINTQISNFKFQTPKSTNSKIIKLFRPPYGQITPNQGKTLIKQGYNIVMWDVLSFDWDNNVSKEKCFNNVISKAKSGSIVVFHDSVKASKNLYYTLPKVLEYFSKKGYRFESID